MKIMKKLMKCLLVLALWAGIGFAVWHFYGAQAMEEIHNTIEEDKQKAALAEQNKDFLDILAEAKKHLDEAALLECEVWERTAGSDPYWVSTAVRDTAASKYRQTIGYGHNSTVTNILGENFMLSCGRFLQECWTRYDTEGEDPCYLELHHCDDKNNDHYIRGDWDQWYFHWDNQMIDYIQRRFNTLPLTLVNQMQVVDYTEVGMEECAGEQAVHYIVTHRPIFNWVEDINLQYIIWDENTNESTYYAPKEYFETAIQQEVKDGYPELYQNFMDLVDKRFYQDNVTHMWIAEDGKLLKMEIDFTLDTYEYTILSNYEDMWMTQEIYDEATGQYVTAATDFALLTPVTREIWFTYGDGVEPIVVPSDYIDLTTQ